MTPHCFVRPATTLDVGEAVAVVRASITQLCTRDHQNNPQVLEAWLSNKTPEIFATWLRDPESLYLVALLDDRICGVGAIHHSGEVRLCYVRPGSERKGVGKALLGGLEADSAGRGQTALHLHSTAAACDFYGRHGYTPNGEPVMRFGGLRSFPYAKSLTNR
jgi:GNAT superfamily N-acetyltransferase